MKISTEQRYDGSWAAVDEDTYDGAPDGDNNFGSGATEQEAIDDLKLLLEEKNMENISLNDFIEKLHALIKVTNNLNDEEICKGLKHLLDHHSPSGA